LCSFRHISIGLDGEYANKIRLSSLRLNTSECVNPLANYLDRSYVLL